MSDWRQARLGEFLKIKHGYAFIGKYITDIFNKNILVTPGNFHLGGGFKTTKFKYFNGDYPSEYVLKEGDIVVTMTDLSKESDTLGYSAMIPTSRNGEKYLHNQRIGLVQFTSNEVNQDYIYWLLRTFEYHWYVVSSASGTSIMHTSPSRICNYEFSLPPLQEQQAIAEVLSSLDDKIDLLHRQNQTLEKMAETLFRQWFIEEAKEEWEVKPLSEIAEFLNGLACQKYPPKNLIDRLPVLKIKELKDGFTENSDWAANDVPSKYHVSNGDVIFSWSASLVVKIWDGEDCILNQHLFKVTSEEFPKWFYYLWSRYHLQQFIAIATAHATTMGHIKRGDLDEAQVNVPSQSEIEEYNKTLEPIIEKIISNNKQIKTLEKQRDTLLPKLMSGEVRLKLDKE